MKKVKSLKESDLLSKGVSAAIENKAKKQKCGFLSLLLGTLAARLLENMSASKGIIWDDGRTLKPGQNFDCNLIL